LEDRLPKAGEIAKRIGGGLKDLRTHLNSHASHLSVSEHSMLHLIDLSEGRLRPVQQFKEPVLRANLETLLASVLWLMVAGVKCLVAAAGGDDDVLVERADALRTRVFSVVRPA
jgi:hypothetical protein